MEQTNYSELLGQARNGNLAALGQLLQHCRPWLSIVASRELDPVLNTRLSGSDLVQQTCLEAIRDLQQFRGDTVEEFSAWLNQILIRNVAEATQVHIIAQKRSIRKESREDSPLANEKLTAQKEPSPSSRAMKGERAMLLANAMSDLSTDQFEAVRLRHIEGWSLTEIADRLERSELAAAGLIKRGLQNLRLSLVQSELR